MVFGGHNSATLRDEYHRRRGHIRGTEVEGICWGVEVAVTVEAEEEDGEFSLGIQVARNSVGSSTHLFHAGLHSAGPSAHITAARSFVFNLLAMDFN